MRKILNSPWLYFGLFLLCNAMALVMALWSCWPFVVVFCIESVCLGAITYGVINGLEVVPNG